MTSRIFACSLQRRGGRDVADKLREACMATDGGGTRRTAKGCAAGSRIYPWQWQEVGMVTGNEGEVHTGATCSTGRYGGKVGVKCKVEKLRRWMAEGHLRPA